MGQQIVALRLYCSMEQQKIAPWLAWTLFILLALTWGSSFILMKRGLDSFSYAQIGFIRIATAWVFTVLVAFKSFAKLKKDLILPLVAVGLFGNGIPYVLFPLAVSHLDSSLVGILNSLVPLFTLVIGIVWFKVRVRWIGALGILTGFLGALWLLLPDLQIDVSRLSYGLYPILATICYAISINVINTRLQSMDSVSITLLSLSAVGPIAIAYLASTNFTEIMHEDPKAWLNFGYISILGIVGSSLAIMVFNILIKRTSSLFAASVTYAIPLVALLWGVWDGEGIGWGSIVGMLLILVGVYLVNLKGSPADRLRRRKMSQKKAP